MENPHDERQAILLDRIVKNSVSTLNGLPCTLAYMILFDKNKCTELVMELNQCLEDIIRANHKVRLASQLAAKYRKNVEYNLKVSGESASSFADPSSWQAKKNMSLCWLTEPSSRFLNHAQ